MSAPRRRESWRTAEPAGTAPAPANVPERDSTGRPGRRPGGCRVAAAADRRSEVHPVRDRGAQAPGRQRALARLDVRRLRRSRDLLPARRGRDHHRAAADRVGAGFRARASSAVRSVRSSSSRRRRCSSPFRSGSRPQAASRRSTGRALFLIKDVALLGISLFVLERGPRRRSAREPGYLAVPSGGSRNQPPLWAVRGKRSVA